MTIHPTFDQAQQLHESGQLDQAKRIYDQLIAQGERLSESWNFVGLIHYQKQQFEEALTSWQKAVALDSNYVDPLLNASYIYLGQGKVSEASAVLKRAYQLAPTKLEVTQQLVRCLILNHDYDQALTLLHQPPLKGANQIDIKLLLCNVCHQLGDFEAAEIALHQALKLDASHPQVIVEKARNLLRHLEYEQAKRELEQALKLFPDFPPLAIAYGKLLLQLKELEKAVSYLQQGLKRSPLDWEGWINLGDALMETGQFKGAIKAFEEAASIYPDHIGIKQKLAKALARFVPPWHAEMLADSERNKAFRMAIDEQVDEQSTVLEIGTGSGILSILAAKAGAKHVYGCEQMPELAEVSKKNVALNGVDQQVTIWNKTSGAISTDEFKEKPTVLLAEILDAGLLGEHVIPSFRHALSNLCESSCVVIPQAAQVKAQLIHMPGMGAVNPIDEVEGVLLSAFDRFRVPMEYQSIQLAKHNYSPCSAEFSLFDVDFTNLWETIPDNASKMISLEVEVTSDQPIHAIAFWFDLQLTDTIALTNHPDRKDNHWGQAIFFFENHTSFEVGKKITVPVFYNDVLIWFDELN